MKVIVFLLVFVGLIYSANTTCSVDTTQPVVNESTQVVSNDEIVYSHEDATINSYFKEITGISEFTKRKVKPSRWTSDMNIFVKGDKPKHLMGELVKIVDELNSIITTININIVDDESQSNYIIFFGSHHEYGKMVPSVKHLIENNYGLFNIITSNQTIISGTMYVDIVRSYGYVEFEKHVLREELTQSLGFINDSYKYPNSIFYQDYSEVTEYSDIDVELIKMMYN